LNSLQVAICINSSFSRLENFCAPLPSSCTPIKNNITLISGTSVSNCCATTCLNSSHFLFISDAFISIWTKVKFRPLARQFFNQLLAALTHHLVYGLKKLIIVIRMRNNIILQNQRHCSTIRIRFSQPQYILLVLSIHHENLIVFFKKSVGEMLRSLCREIDPIFFGDSDRSSVWRLSDMPVARTC